MRAAIIGLPQSGKSTVFVAATGLSVDPYAPPEPRTAVVGVPDYRLTYLTELCHPKKVIEATMELVDLPGCSLDDTKSQQQWRRLLPVIRQTDLLVVVVRRFENPAVPPYHDRVDPKADFSVVWDELIFADLDAVTTRVERIEAALKKPTKTHDASKRELGLLLRCREALEAGQPLSGVVTTEEDRKQVSSFSFLTEKPLVCVVNHSEDQPGEEVNLALVAVQETLPIHAAIEAEIAQLPPPDRPAFLADLGLQEPTRDRLLHSCYRAAGMISFLTMGPDEVRAWPIPAGSTAVQAAAKIHTDIARGFIRAETVSYDDLREHKDLKGARAAGKVRKEGKSYVVADGDILNILCSA